MVATKFILATAIISCCLVSSAIAQDFDAVNLLSLKETTLVKESSSNKGPNESAIRDNDEKSIAKFTARKESPVELVYHFGGETVAPQGFTILTKGLKAKQAKIEILVSMLSPTSGYRSLRTEPLRASTDFASKFTFDRVAAKWVMIKITPFQENVVVSVRELSLLGKVGQPESIYRFDESPAEAIEVIAKLKDSVNVTVSGDEAALLKDAADGKLDDISFAEASLISSGVLDESKRQALLAEIDKLEASIKKQIPESLPAFERGKKILQLLHNSTFAAGYESKQTDVATVLTTKKFNCVSSATLYNILARRMGLDARGIEVPDHAFSILYDGTSHVDIETTSRLGFNPSRYREAWSEFEQRTGFVYIPDSNRSKRREVNVPGMIALTYYNHGVDLFKSKQYQAALVSYFKALSLDPKNKSAVKNALASLTGWSKQLCKEGDLDKAASVLSIGLELAPNDRVIKQHHRYVWQQKAAAAVKQDNLDLAIAHFRTAYEESNDKEFLRRQSWAYMKLANKRIKTGKWDDAVKIAGEGLTKVDESVRWELKRWLENAFLKWSRTEFEKKNFAESVEILERGLQATENNYQLKKRIAFLVQEWAKHVFKTEGDEAGLALVVKLSKRFPDNGPVQAVASSYSIKKANKLIDTGDFQAATEIYSEARKLRPDDFQLKRNEENAWNAWGLKHIDDKQWKKALDVYKKARTARPDVYNFQKNIVFVVQEWSREVADAEGVATAEKLIAEQAVAFEDVSGVKNMRGRQLIRKAAELLAEKKYEEAEQMMFKHRELDCVRYKFDEFASHVYRQHANDDLANKRWQNAIAIFEKGFKNHPDVNGIKKNLLYSWDSWARESMEKEDWQSAIDILEKGLKSMPDHHHLKTNLRYCKTKLE